MNENGLPQTGAMPKDPQGDKPNDSAVIIEEVMKRMEIAVAADSENHKEALDDLEFLKGNQWPEVQRRQREMEGRPCLTINKIPTFLQQVTNDQRQNRASIKVSPVGLRADAETAEVIQGVIRHIEYQSAADVAYDTAVNSAAAIGFGFFRITTGYCKDDSFDQDIMIKRIRNSFTVYMDPAATEADGSDQQWCVITEKMTKTEFQAKYPKAEATLQGFTARSVGDSVSEKWVWSDGVRVAEYYRMVFTPATLYKLEDGTTTFDSPPEGTVIVAQRKTVKRLVMWYKLTPYEILEQTEIKCRWIPVFPVYGTEVDIDGKIYRAGLIRNAKDPAMMYNYWMTSATEEVAMRPKVPFIGAVGQFEGQEKNWLQANNRSFPFLQYNPMNIDGQLAPPPQRQQAADVPSGILTMAAHASDNIKQTTGLFDSSLGAAGNATSGKQELAQQKQGNVANFHYMDNFIRTLRHAGKCIIDMIPHYYDAERLVECQGEDGTIEAKWVNKMDEAAQQITHDLTIAEYDVVVTAGPSYATMRAEAQDSMIQFGQSWPKLMDIAGDKMVKAMNWPGADEISDRIKKTIPKELLDEEGQPDPKQLQQQIQQLTQQLKEAQQDADDNKVKLAIEESRSKTALEAALIGNEGKADVEELKGMVALLLAGMPVPAELGTAVSADIAQDQQRGSQQEAQQPQPAQPVGQVPASVNDVPQQ